MRPMHQASSCRQGNNINKVCHRISFRRRAVLVDYHGFIYAFARVKAGGLVDMRLSVYTFAAIALLMSTRVVASYITLVTGFSLTEAADALTLNVTTTNQGDEPAYGIQFEVQIGEQTFTSASVPQLAVNETTSSDFSVLDAFDLPGRYPVLIKIHYKDANTYPFTSLAVGSYDFQQPVVSKILIRGEDTGLPSNSKGVMKYTVRNNDSAEHDLALRLHLPDELAALKDSDSLTIGPGESKSLHYTIENFSALENSSYAITLVAEYDDGKSHYSSAGSAAIRITEPDISDEYLPWVVALVSAFIVIFLIIIRLRRK